MWLKAMNLGKSIDIQGLLNKGDKTRFSASEEHSLQLVWNEVDSCGSGKIKILEAGVSKGEYMRV